MKTLILIFAYLALGHSQLTGYSGYHSPYSSSYSQMMMQRRNSIANLKAKVEAVCPGKSDEFDEAILEMSECVEGLDMNENTICSLLTTNSQRCSRPIISFLEGCLPEESKATPRLVYKIIDSATAYLCKTDGEHIFELINYSCLMKQNSKTLRCQNRIKAKLQQYSSKPPTRDGICDLITSAKPCLHDHLKYNCGHRITRESFENLFDALSVPCKGSSEPYNPVRNEVEILE